MEHELGKIGLFWSGSLGRQAAELHARLLRLVFPNTGVFISTETVPGDPWFETIRSEIRQAAVGLFFLTADALESRWLPYECGQMAATRDLSAIIPVRVGVSQQLVDARMPVLQPHNASQFGTQAAFAALCTTSAVQLRDNRPAFAIVDAASEAWRSSTSEVEALVAAAKRALPNDYAGAARYAGSIQGSNFNMPGVLSMFDKELFLVGINHSYILNIEHNPSNMLALVDRLLRGRAGARARFLISDMWEPSVFDCYRRLVHEGIAAGELAAFTNAYKTPAEPAHIANVIQNAYGRTGLERILEERLLEIRAYATILDTFWLIDRGTGRGRCQLSLANAMEGPSRPFFFCGEDDQPAIFNYYYGLAETAFGVAKRIWPERGSERGSTKRPKKAKRRGS